MNNDKAKDKIVNLCDDSIIAPVGPVHCKIGTQPCVVVINRKRRSIRVGDKISIRIAGPGHKWIRVTVANIEPLRVNR